LQGEAKNINKREKTSAFLRQTTKKLLVQGTLAEANTDANAVACALDMDRTNASKLLNMMWNDGQIVKMQGRPTLFLDYQALEEAFPSKFIPLTIAKKEELLRLFEQNADKSPVNRSDRGEKAFIGGDGSLKIPLQRAQAVISYPPHGLPVLIINPSRDDVAEFVSYLFSSLQKIGLKPADSSLVTVDCRGCEHAPGLFIQQLFGCSKSASRSGKAVRGHVEACNMGIVYLEGVHRLPERVLEILLTALDKGAFCRVGDTLSHPLTATVILSLPHKSNEPLIEELQKHIPLTLNLPDIDSRGLYEKTALVIDAFSREAAALSRTLRVEKDVILCFMAAAYTGGRKEMHNEVKLLCSSARIVTYPEASGSGTIDVKCNFLSSRILKAADSNPVRREQIAETLSLIPNDYFFFLPDGNSNALAFLGNLPFRGEMLDIMPYTKIFFLDLERISDDSEYAHRILAYLRKSEPAHIASLQELVPSYFYQSVVEIFRKEKMFEPLLAEKSFLLGIMIPMLHIVLSSSTRAPSDPERHGDASDMQPVSAEYSVCSKIADTSRKFYGTPLTRREITFFAHYLQEAMRMLSGKTVAILLIFHGEATATDLANYVRRSAGERLSITGINYSSEMEMHELAAQAESIAKTINRGGGIIVATDMPPLASIGGIISERIGIPCRAVSSVSLPLLLDLAAKCMQGLPLDSILSSPAGKYYSPETAARAGRYDEFMERYIKNVLTQNLTFLDTNKAVNALLIVLENILGELSLAYSHEIAIKFLTHSAHMLERTILNTPLHFPGFKRFVDANRELMLLVEKHLVFAAKTFGVTVPANEIAYIVEIFNDYKSNSPQAQTVK